MYFYISVVFLKERNTVEFTADWLLDQLTQASIQVKLMKTIQL